jgi:hypothetical protein
MSNQKPLEWFAEGGLVYCINPNKPDKKPTYLQPLDALSRVAKTIKIFITDMHEKPKDYAVTQAVLANFFNEFKTKVFDIALEQDAQAGNMIAKTNQEYVIAKQEMMREQAIAEAKAAEKKPRVDLGGRRIIKKKKQTKKD